MKKKSIEEMILSELKLVFRGFLLDWEYQFNTSFFSKLSPEQQDQVVLAMIQMNLRFIDMLNNGAPANDIH